MVTLRHADYIMKYLETTCRRLMLLGIINLMRDILNGAKAVNSAVQSNYDRASARKADFSCKCVSLKHMFK